MEHEPADAVPEEAVSPRQFAENYRTWRVKTFLVHDQDGPLVGALRWFFGFPAWHDPIEWLTFKWLDRSPSSNTPIPKSEAKARFNEAIEYVWLFWTVALLVAYALTWLAAKRDSFNPTNSCVSILHAAWVVVLALLAAYRVIDLLALFIRLHVLEPYVTTVPAHAIVLTFFAYLHVALCFAVFYLGCAVLTGDRFSKNNDPALWSGPLDSLYFSMITIATVGYGDFSPTKSAGKLLVMTEVLIGLALIVVVVQRVITGAKYAKDGKTAHPNSSAPANRDAVIGDQGNSNAETTD